jgi:UDP-glucose 4-epimerase/UDP-arabinose 4-epimerase
MATAVLVAGGAGYIGAQTCKALFQAGFTPVCIDNLATGYREAVKWGPFVEADIRDLEAVSRAIRDHDCKAAIHFAASSLVGESNSNPYKYYDNNVGAATAFAHGLVEGGVRALVFSSTAAVYGNPQSDLISEDHPKSPINAYGATKLAFEQALFWFGRAHGLRHVVLRYFNAAGADPDGEVGESHEPETHLIPNICKAALGTGPALSIYGDDYPTPDGTAIRDYIHVVDLAEAHVAAIRHLLNGGDDLTLNVGTGKGASVAEVLAAAERVHGAKVPASYGPRRAGDPKALVADATSIRQALNWEPRCSDLDTVIRDALNWQKNRSY